MYTYWEGVQGQGQPEEVGLKQGKNFIYLSSWVSQRNLNQEPQAIFTLLMVLSLKGVKVQSRFLDLFCSEYKTL